MNSVWVKLSGFPREWWSKEGLTSIGNRLGGFLTVDNHCMHSTRRTMANILINLKMQGGLYESIVMVCREKRYSQLIDYVNLHFRCLCCHCIGHLFEDCKLPKFQRKWVPQDNSEKVFKEVGSPHKGRTKLT